MESKAPFVGTKNINTLWFFSASNILFTFSEVFRLWMVTDSVVVHGTALFPGWKSFNNTIYLY